MKIKGLGKLLKHSIVHRTGVKQTSNIQKMQQHAIETQKQEQFEQMLKETVKTTTRIKLG